MGLEGESQSCQGLDCRHTGGQSMGHGKEQRLRRDASRRFKGGDGQESPQGTDKKMPPENEEHPGGDPKGGTGGG